MQSLVTRFGRLLFAFLAVWCLGCNSFEMFASAFGQDQSMSACSDDAASQNVSGEKQLTIAASSANQASPISPGCGCDHCVGTEIIVAEVLPIEGLLPPPLNDAAQFPALVTREPAVPPPERIVAV
jgi:hypothetical protein